MRKPHEMREHGARKEQASLRVISNGEFPGKGATGGPPSRDHLRVASDAAHDASSKRSADAAARVSDGSATKDPRTEQDPHEQTGDGEGVEVPRETEATISTLGKPWVGILTALLLIALIAAITIALS